MFYQWYLDAMAENAETCHCSTTYDPTQHDGRCGHCEDINCKSDDNCPIAQENE